MIPKDAAELLFQVISECYEPLAFSLFGTIICLASDKWRTTMKKTVLILIIIAALVLSLAACKSSSAAQPEENAGTDAPLVTGAPQQSLEADAEQPAAEAIETAAPLETEEDVYTMTAYRAGGEPVILKGKDGIFTTEDGTVYALGNDGMLRAEGFEDLYINDLAAKAAAPEDAVGTAPVIARQDGERFEAVIVMEGMEETVNYEHIRNESLGFEMDYDCETFSRSHEEDCERFVLAWDDPAKPEYYLELSYNPESAEYVAGAISEALSAEYELYRDDSYMLEHAGRCIYISTTSVKGGDYLPEHLQTVYVIPAGDGCIVAMEHCAIESAEGIGRRFTYMMHTLSLIEK